LKIFKEIESEWHKYSIITYPYSGALYIYDAIMFTDIYKCSLKDMDNALRILLKTDPDMFYRIKNLVFEVEKHISTPTHSSVKAKTLKHRFIVVNNKHSFSDESANSYLYAPNDSYHKVLYEVNKGDICLHIFEGKLHAISLPKGSCYYSSTAYGGLKVGNFIDAIYHKYANPIDIRCLNKHPDYPNKKGNQKYMKIYKDNQIIELIIDEALKHYPNDSLLLLIKQNLL
jgi:hypothetical protein